MAEKLAVYAQRAGVANVDLVVRAYWLALRPRLAALSDVFHYDMLHPARTALILLENVHCTEAVVLAAAQLTETAAPSLRVADAEILKAVGPDVTSLVRAVPDPVTAAETLVEALVTIDEPPALIALAERLDHARHLHMRERNEWRPYFEQTVAAYLPVAARLSPELSHRFQRWAAAFEQRLN